MDRLATDPGLVGRQVQSEIAGDEDVVGRVEMTPLPRSTVPPDHHVPANLVPSTHNPFVRRCPTNSHTRVFRPCVQNRNGALSGRACSLRSDRRDELPDEGIDPRSGRRRARAALSVSRMTTPPRDVRRRSFVKSPDGGCHGGARKTTLGLMFQMQPAQVFASYHRKHLDCIVVAATGRLRRDSAPVRRSRRRMHSVDRSLRFEPRLAPS